MGLAQLIWFLRVGRRHPMWFIKES
ncbi:hypothetical protein Patl1_18618 [Pistacia atlantica]|uniref:Uncharacterized protein n=1 Tax=Pistacia atlantica TaxID=434234 RepID=A0ACC1C1R1_9ROSI|nr:hypothetical protein Patl1_18618 [Pistacia atlantica]